jgi:hypothetical protein
MKLFANHNKTAAESYICSKIPILKKTLSVFPYKSLNLCGALSSPLPKHCAIFDRQLHLKMTRLQEEQREQMFASCY